MQDDYDRTEADRTHEGYQQRYEKERHASYVLVIFGLLAFVAIAGLMFMRHTGVGTGNYANIEPAAGANTTMDNTTNTVMLVYTMTNTTMDNTTTNTTNTAP